MFPVLLAGAGRLLREWVRYAGRKWYGFGADRRIFSSRLRAPAMTPCGRGAAFDDRIRFDWTGRVVFFALDKSDINSESMKILDGPCAVSVDRARMSMFGIEGHADERGSREYNIGLGERRAQAVREVLLLRGVSVREE